MHGGVTGVVLAGGASSRFGSSKAAALLGDRPLIDYPLSAIAAAGLPALVVAKADSDVERFAEAFEAELLIEPDEPRHPLCGIVAALDHTGGPIVTVACDMPFVNARVIEQLAGLSVPLAVVEVEHRPQPMLGRYSPEALPALTEALRDETSAREALRRAGAHYVPAAALKGCADPDLLIRDIDTPEDLAAAETAAIHH